MGFPAFVTSDYGALHSAQGALEVSATVTNTGQVAGSDVAQLYLSDPSGSGEPPRQLAGFQRVNVAPGASAQVSFAITPQEMSWWDGLPGYPSQLLAQRERRHPRDCDDGRHDPGAGVSVTVLPC